MRSQKKLTTISKTDNDPRKGIKVKKREHEKANFHSKLNEKSLFHQVCVY